MLEINKAEAFKDEMVIKSGGNDLDKKLKRNKSKLKKNVLNRDKPKVIEKVVESDIDTDDTTTINPFVELGLLNQNLDKMFKNTNIIVEIEYYNDLIQYV